MHDELAELREVGLPLEEPRQVGAADGGGHQTRAERLAADLVRFRAHPARGDHRDQVTARHPPSGPHTGESRFQPDVGELGSACITGGRRASYRCEKPTVSLAVHGQS
ncbi:hypothetical protein [Streptosporangium sp. CA-115845]|uniref:hypothetical protein n=1 Tax=Streptosporangium sp. CA-115845 TaxID=3240071 RepID=UPI003D946CBB